MKPDFTRSLLWLWLGVAFGLGSCTKDADADVALLNKRWQLTDVGATPIGVSSFFHDSQSYIRFNATGNKLRGLSACDEIGGQFSLDAATSTLNITQITVKPGICVSPVIGGLYLAALPRTVSYKLDNNTLRLYGHSLDPTPILTFRAED